MMTWHLAWALLALGAVCGMVAGDVYDRYVIEPRRRRESRAEIEAFWRDAFEQWERSNEQKKRRGP